MNKKGQKGFTLIELVIVIAILGVLAALIVPSVANRTTEAKTNVDKTNAKLIENALNLYLAESNDQDLSEMGLAAADIVNGVVVDDKTDDVINALKNGVGNYGPYLSADTSTTPQNGTKYEITINKHSAKVAVK